MTMPLLYSGMVDVACAELIASGIDEAAATVLAERIAESFCEKHGGMIMRIPVLSGKFKRERDAALIEDSENMGVDELARKYGLSRARVYSITNTARIQSEDQGTNLSSTRFAGRSSG